MKRKLTLASLNVALVLAPVIIWIISYCNGYLFQWNLRQIALLMCITGLCFFGAFIGNYIDKN